MSQKTVGEKTRTRGKASLSQITNPISPAEISPHKITEPQELFGTEMGMTQIIERLDQLDRKVTQTNTDIANMTALLADSRKEHEADRHKLLITTQSMEQLRTANKKLSKQLNDIENQAKICNLKIDGKREEANEDLKRYVNEILTYLNPEVNTAEVVSVSRLGRKPLLQQTTRHPTRYNDRPRPILVVFSNVHARNAIYFSRTKLGKSDNFRGIYLNDDVTQLTRKTREEYRSVAALARAEGCEIRVHSDGIVIDGHKYRHDDNLPERFTLDKAKTVNIDGEIFFHSEHSYLSNFYPSPIIQGETVHPTAEHRFQSAKCLLANDHHRLKEIQQAATPLEAKRIADQIPDTPEWRAHRDEALTKTIDEKFRQNKQLIELLLSTGDARLNEATTNAYYGIGANLHSREVRDKSYKGLNKLGLTLMKKRNDIRAERATPPQQ